MPSFKEYKPVIEIPKLVSLDIIDLNRRLRKRRKKMGTNLWNVLPDDDNLYLNEYTEIMRNKNLQRYLDDNNLKIIRYRINA